MSILIYIDTNVYLDFLIKDRPKIFAEEAFRLFNRTLECEFEIILSNKIKTELYPSINGKESALLFEMLMHKLRIMNITDEDMKEAKNLDPINTADALHAVLAKRGGAKHIITQNIRHFWKFSALIKPLRPSEL